MKVRGVLSRLRNEDGIATVVVVVCVIAFMGALMLTLDAGNLWSSRRNEITGTDAAVLDAALKFNSGALNPCDAANQVMGGPADVSAANVLTTNNSRSLHNNTDTPDGFEVKLADPSLCGAPYVPGQVRFDGRLPSASFFSQVFGFNNLSAVSSSIAAWGYVTEIGDQLRRSAVCDKGENYDLWMRFWRGDIPQDIAPAADFHPTEYPNSSHSSFGRDSALQSLPSTDPG